MAWSRAFQKCIICHFWTNFFCKHFYYITGFCDKKFNFCKLAIFLQILKVEHKSFLMMYHLSYLEINTWGFLVFKYPSRDRVKQAKKVKIHQNQIKNILSRMINGFYERSDVTMVSELFIILKFPL